MPILPILMIGAVVYGLWSIKSAVDESDREREEQEKGDKLDK